MRRREFIAGLMLAFLASGARAEEPLRRIGFLSARSPGESEHLVSAFRRGLAESGFAEGRNVTIAFRWAEGRYDRLPALAADLVEQRVALILAAGGTPPALAAKAATAAIPVIFSGTADPLGAGLVASLSRPGGNVTGMSTFSPEMLAKCVELLKDLLPTTSSVVLLVNPSNPGRDLAVNEAQRSANALGIKLHVIDARADDEMERAFSSAASLHANGLVIPAEPFFDSQREKIVALSARLGVAAIFPWREYVEVGGLMSYGPSLAESYRQAGLYAGRILKGEKPADLPVVQPSKFELVINLKTANALGIKVPATIVNRADEVIE